MARAVAVALGSCALVPIGGEGRARGLGAVVRGRRGGGFRRYATYRAATAAGVFTNTVFGLILVYTYLALWEENPQLGGYDQAQAVTFVWLGQALLAALAIGGGGSRTN